MAPARGAPLNLREKLYKRKRVYDGRVISVSSDTIILPNKKLAYREYIEHPGAVCVLAFTDKKNIVLVKQFRYPVGKITYELPAGKLDKGEKPASCVRRELLEETGYYAKKIKKIYSFWPTPAFSNEVLHIFFAECLEKRSLNLDEDEFLEPEIVPFAKALDWVKKGKMKDSKTVIAILLWIAKNIKSKSY